MIEGARRRIRQNSAPTYAITTLLTRDVEGPRMCIGFSDAVECDLEWLVQVRIDAMRDSLDRVGRFDPMRARDRFVSTFSAADTRLIQVDGQRVGFFVLKRREGVIALEHLYIVPAQQNRGIGKAVLENLFDTADALGLAVRVGALRGSDSNRFYSRHGFQRYAESEFDIYYERPRSTIR